MATCNVVKANAPDTSALDEKQSIEITVNFGIFFDGTNNQRLQVAMGKLHRAKEQGKYLEENEERMIESLAWDNASPKKEGETNIQALDRLSGFRVGMPRSSMQNVDFTNIARLEPLYDYTQESDYTYRIYVSGSGTFANLNKGVDVTGLAAGQNSAGVVQKVMDALNAIAKVVGKYMTDDSIDKVHYSFNVFGFSRGATEARLFVDLCSKVRDGKRPKKLKKIIQKYNKDFAIEKKMKSDSSAISFVKQTEIKFPFVGLFDTVSSVGVDAGIWNNSILAGGLELAESLSSSVSKFHKQNNDDLGLDTLVEDNIVEHVVHICALDEFRENFALQVLPLVSKVDQFFMPGTHADIGGGDLEGYAEDKYIPKVYNRKVLYVPGVVTPGRPQNKKNLVELNIQGLKELGWIKDDDIIIKDKEDTLILKKHSEYGYTFLPLNIMANKARKYSCSFKELKSKYQIPKDLPQTFSNVQTDWSGVGGKYGHCYFPNDKNDIKNKNYKILRQKYLHFSSCIKETLGIAFVNAPNLAMSNDTKDPVLYYDRFLTMERVEESKPVWSRDIHTGRFVPSSILFQGAEGFDPNAATDKQKGNFGEIVAHNFLQSNPLLKEKGLDLNRIDKEQPDNLNASGHQGIDGIFKNNTPPPKYVIIEVKYGQSKLQKHEKCYQEKETGDNNNKAEESIVKREFTQMSVEWILGNNRLVSSVGYKEAHYIRKMIRSKYVEKVLVHVDEQGNVTTTRLDNFGNENGQWP